VWSRAGVGSQGSNRGVEVPLAGAREGDVGACNCESIEPGEDLVYNLSVCCLTVSSEAISATLGLSLDHCFIACRLTSPGANP